MTTPIYNNHKFILAVFLILESIFILNTSFAFTIIPNIKNNQFQILIKDLKTPENFERDLKSGLNNIIVFRIYFDGAKDLSFERVYKITVKYDLWDEVYFLTILPENKVQGDKFIFKSEADIVTFFKLIQLVIIDTIDFSKLNIAKQTLIQFQGTAFFNPIAAEKIEKINKWVLQNSTPLTTGGESFLDGNSRKISSQRSNTFFNQIYTEYSKGVKNISIFKDTSEPKNIIWSEVIIEK